MNIKKLIKSIYPALIVVLLYVVVTVLRSVGILNGYYIQVMMFAGINIMMTASLTWSMALLDSSVLATLALCP